MTLLGNVVRSKCAIASLLKYGSFIQGIVCHVKGESGVIWWRSLTYLMCTNDVGTFFIHSFSATTFAFTVKPIPGTLGMKHKEYTLSITGHNAHTNVHTCSNMRTS